MGIRVLAPYLNFKVFSVNGKEKEKVGKEGQNMYL